LDGLREEREEVEERKREIMVGKMLEMEEERNRMEDKWKEEFRINVELRDKI